MLQGACEHREAMAACLRPRGLLLNRTHDDTIRTVPLCKITGSDHLSPDRCTRRVLEPALARARLRIAVIELETGHVEAAAKHVNRVLLGRVTRDVQAQAWFVRGMAAFHLGCDDEALRCMQRSIVLKPHDGFAHQWHAVIDALRGREHHAAGHLALFNERAPGHSIASLKATERSCNALFRSQRARFYVGLQRAGMPR